MRKTANAADMKQLNQNAVLNYIRDNHFSRADIARKTGLTRASVTNIVDALIEAGLVAEHMGVRSTVGRTPHILDLNPDARFAVGIDLTRHGYRVGLTDLCGTLRMVRTPDTDESAGWQGVLECLLAEMEDMIDVSGIAREKLLGLGVVAPGPLDFRGGVILNPPNYALWEDAAVVDFLQERIALPVMLDNNSKALAKAEKHYGAGRKMRNYILVVVDEGVGAGVVIDGKLYRGAMGFEGEIGHISVERGGRLCACGNRGCLECYASVPAMVRRVREEVDVSSWEQIADLAYEGNEACLAAVDAQAQYLFAALSGAVNLYGISNIILSGPLTYRSELLYEKIAEQFRRVALYRHYAPVRLCDAQLRENAAVISATNLVLDAFFEGY